SEMHSLELPQTTDEKSNIQSENKEQASSKSRKRKLGADDSKNTNSDQSVDQSTQKRTRSSSINEIEAIDLTKEETLKAISIPTQPDNDDPHSTQIQIRLPSDCTLSLDSLDEFGSGKIINKNLVTRRWSL